MRSLGRSGGLLLLLLRRRRRQRSRADSMQQAVTRIVTERDCEKKPRLGYPVLYRSRLGHSGRRCPAAARVKRRRDGRAPACIFPSGFPGPRSASGLGPVSKRVRVSRASGPSSLMPPRPHARQGPPNRPNRPNRPNPHKARLNTALKKGCLCRLTAARLAA